MTAPAGFATVTAMLSPTAVRVMRAIAIAIAVLAVTDPVITRSRADKPTIAVVAADASADSAAAFRVRAELASRFDVIAGPYSAADATVIVGTGLPESSERLAKPVFVVNPSGPRVEIERVDAPSVTPLESSVRVAAILRTRNANGRTLNVSLGANGANAGTASVRIASDSERVEVPLTFAPTSSAPTRLQVTADVGGVPVHADRTIDITTRPWRVLFHDPRPSWTSTFVRRAIERDSRFDVASRIGATRNASSNAGRPAQLSDAAGVDALDLIVVGAPDALTAGEADALERYMRRRGGSIVFLLDQRLAVASPAARLIGAGEWRTRDAGAALALRAGSRDSAALRGIELAWPARLPVGAEAVATVNPQPSTLNPQPIIWRSSLGPGTMVVSGALDAWRYRDASQSNFDGFWRELIASEAARSVPALDVQLTPSVARAGDRVRVSVAVRAPSIAAASVNGSLNQRAVVNASIGGTPITLWPSENVGTLEGEFVAPKDGGLVKVVSGRDSALTPLISHLTTSRLTSRLRGLTSVAQAMGGAVIEESNLSQLRDALRANLNPAARSEPWHPMRSAWWLLPFALLLSAEWHSRRRRGMA